MRQDDYYLVAKDGMTMATCGSHNEAFAWIHRHTSFSVMWATEHEGYSIVRVVRVVADEVARDDYCAGCSIKLDEDDIVWIAADGRASTSEGQAYCVGCAPAEVAA